MNLLFTYGSLKHGQEAHHLLSQAKRHPDGILDGFEFTHKEGYPLIRQGQGSIKGEVYEISCDNWSVLDDWEGVPNLYKRTTIKLRDGRITWVYIGASD